MALLQFVECLLSIGLFGKYAFYHHHILAGLAEVCIAVDHRELLVGDDISRLHDV